MQTLENLFIDELKDIYYAEKQVVKALPKMAKAASNSDLEKAFKAHLSETEGHIQRLERIFKLMNLPLRGKKCAGMNGILEEGKEILEKKKDFEPNALDAALIASAQRVEHYEIAAYGTLCAFAARMGRDKVVNILQDTLEEEKGADKKLSEIAESSVNESAKDSMKAA